MPELTENEQHVANTVLSSLKAYYKLAQSASTDQRQTIIQDETLKKIFVDFCVNPSAEISLYFCKVLIILSDNPQNAYLMNKQGYTRLVGTICEQTIPPKLVDKFLRIQSRLMKAQLDGGEDQKVNPTRKQRQRTTKELIFVLPILSAQQQACISQSVLSVDGCISVSFRTDVAKEESKCFVRCKKYVEARKIANEIIKIGFDEVNFLHKTDEGNEELFQFYRDENASPPPVDDLPQYLDDNIEVFDPATAIVTNDYKSSNAGTGWFSSMLSFW